MSFPPLPHLTANRLYFKLYYYICPKPCEALPHCPKNNGGQSQAWAGKLLMQWEQPTPGHARKHNEPEEKAVSGGKLQAYRI